MLITTRSTDHNIIPSLPCPNLRARIRAASPRTSLPCPRAGRFPPLLISLDTYLFQKRFKVHSYMEVYLSIYAIQ